MTSGRGAATSGPRPRDDAWDAVSRSTFDLLVVGGGVTGPAWHSTPRTEGCEWHWSRRATLRR